MAKCRPCEQTVVLNGGGSKDKEVRKEVKGLIKNGIMYFCPHCEKVLGFGSCFGGLLSGRP